METFIEDVKNMRLLQIRFFEGDKTVINKCKALEQIVDIQLGIKEPEKTNQLNLF